MANRLINEQSPYLLQHAHNPVDWYPWCDEAFERARVEHKPLIVSIGYAACHWCHVMEHESFEDEATAAYMNAHFICVKVDREEHPDVDHMYMDAVQAIAGNGGWPLNVFVTPDRAPFYGGTYYPPKPAYSRPSWLQLMQRMNEIWTTQHDEVTHQATQLIEHLQQASRKLTATGSKAPDRATCRLIADTLLKMADKEKGGFGNAPKFPGTMAITYLLEHYHYTRYEPALSHALLSLDAMIAGGIYDQLEGGFARYSTDREWLAPHFEKMLYDNALLVSALSDAFMLTGNQRYKEVIDHTLAFAERELKDASGGYYCALDADSEGEEGKFYTWTWEEWQSAAGENSDAAAAYFGVSHAGNWEGTNILHIARSIESIALETGLDASVVADQINVVKHRLMAVRAGRIRPQTDDKCLLSWNALMNIALVRAALANLSADAAGSEQYLLRATSHMNWMMAQFMTPAGLMHTWKNGIAKIPAMLDDYAYLIQALLQLSAASGNNKWALIAAGLVDTTVTEFGAENGYFYYTSSRSNDIPVRKIDNYDGALPSANAVMAQNLWQAGMLMERNDWIDRSDAMVGQMGDTVSRYSYSFSYWAQLLQRQVVGLRTVVCAGNGAKQHTIQIQKHYIPHAYLVTLEKEIFELPILENKFFADKMYIFVCSGHACLSPESTVEDALRIIDSENVY